VDVKIVDDEGNELPTGEKGELIYRGPNVMKSTTENYQKLKKFSKMVGSTPEILL
jgi:long-chain acyl-CoA synthetase